MVLKSFVTACRQYTNHYVSINKCAGCTYKTAINHNLGTVNCTYDELGVFDAKPVQNPNSTADNPT